MSELLLVDDDTEVLLINQKYFLHEGYSVLTARDAVSALKILEQHHPDCIILDIMMPGIDGFTACAQIKKLTDAPIIFLSGKNSEDDKIHGLLQGAEDYIVKPYSLRELSARIQVQLRRHRDIHADQMQISYPPLLLNLVEHKAYCNQEEILLSNREYELLQFLASRPGQVTTFEQIGMKLWNLYSEADRRTIMVVASRLRKKLDSYEGLSNLIETVWSQGYQFIVK